MEKLPTLHFGGLWAPIRPDGAQKRPRPALMFFGVYYCARLELTDGQSAKGGITFSGFTYELTADEFLTQSTYDDGVRPEPPIQRIKWRLFDDGTLEFLQDGVRSRWEPVSPEDLAEDGYPLVLFESCIQRFAEEGLFHIDRGLAPHSSAFEAQKIAEERERHD